MKQVGIFTAPEPGIWEFTYPLKWNQTSSKKKILQDIYTILYKLLESSAVTHPFFLFFSFFRFMTDLNSVWMQFDTFCSPLYGSIGNSSLLGKFSLMIFLETEVNVSWYLLNCNYLEQKDDQNDVSHQYSQFHRNAWRDVEL
jgi:hypothetical protein